MKDNPSYIVTLLLATFPTGWIGLHHIYVGNKYKGLFYLLFFWTLIPIVASYFDVFLLVKRGQDNFIDKYHDEENKEEYYMKKLAENNPNAVNDEVLDNITGVTKQNSNEENTNKNDQESKTEVEGENSKEETDEDYIDEPDYSDYYGSFN